MANHFIWHELNTTDRDAAARFYRAVVGWDTKPYEGGGDYRIFTMDGRDGAGLMALPEAARAGGPYWASYLHVADVDAEAAAIKDKGGAIHAGPQDIPTVGRFAVVGDPQGAVYMILAPAPRGDVPARPPASTPGEVGWHELHATDWRAAFDFYARYGWTKSHEFDMGAMGTYQIFGIDGTDAGGMMTSPLKPQWLPYVSVADIDAARAAIEANGGRIMHGPVEVPGGAFIIQGTDPQGATFALAGPRKG